MHGSLNFRYGWDQNNQTTLGCVEVYTSRMGGTKKPGNAWKYKLLGWSRFYFEIEPWDAWKFILPGWSWFDSQMKPWDAWKFLF